MLAIEIKKFKRDTGKSLTDLATGIENKYGIPVKKQHIKHWLDGAIPGVAYFHAVCEYCGIDPAPIIKNLIRNKKEEKK